MIFWQKGETFFLEWIFGVVGITRTTLCGPPPIPLFSNELSILSFAWIMVLKVGQNQVVSPHTWRFWSWLIFRGFSPKPKMYRNSLLSPLSLLSSSSSLSLKPCPNHLGSTTWIMFLQSSLYNHGISISQNSCGSRDKSTRPAVNLPDATLLFYQGLGPSITTNWQYYTFIYTHTYFYLKHPWAIYNEDSLPPYILIFLLDSFF